MYKNIKIEPVKNILKEQVIQNLGQIVVICGKNNSGKTTLLNSLFKGTSVLKKEDFNTEDSVNIIFGRESDESLRSYNINIQKILNSEVFNIKKFWDQMILIFSIGKFIVH